MSEQETQTQPDAPVVETPVVEEAKVHPAYEKLLQEIPEAWHSKITPHLQEQDRYFQQQLEKYSSFKNFVDQGISPDVINGGLNLANAIEQNPLEVFNSLKDYLTEQGMLEADAQKMAEEIVSNESEGEIPSELRKELDELKSFKTQQEERFQAIELEKATAEAAVELDRDMATLKSQYTLTEAHEVAIYNLMNASLNAGKAISVAEAAKQLQQMVGNFAPVGGSANAPTVVGASGGAGIPAQDLSVPKTDAGKKEMLAKMFAEYNANR